MVLAFCWFRGAAFERTEEEEGESAAGVLAGHEGVHALPPVVAALLPRPLLRFRDDLALQVDQQVAEFREPGAGGGDRPGGGLDRAGVPWKGRTARLLRRRPWAGSCTRSSQPPRC